MNIDQSALNILKVNKILLMYKYKLADHNETSLLSANYIKKFTTEALPENFNLFDDEDEDEDENENENENEKM